MAKTKAQMRATAKSDKKKYHQVLIKVPKGRRDVIQAYAEAAGMSMAEYLNTAAEEKAERDGLKD